MSNVIKYGRVYLNQEDKKVIDSNENPVFRPLSLISGCEQIIEEEQKPEETVNPEEFLMEEKERFLEEADKILSDARIQADFQLKEAQKKSDELKSQAMAGGRELGYQEGLKKARQEMEQEKKAWQDKKKELEDRYRKEMEQLEPSMAELMVGLIRNITGVFLEERKGIICHLIERALGQVKKNNRFSIKVGQEDYASVLAFKQILLNAVGEGKQLDIEEDSSLIKGKCMIETDDRIVDCSFDVEVDNLCESLKLLSRG